MITVGSLFSGIGGIELGLERTGGFKTIWQCENDAYASAVLRKNYPKVPNFGDIKRVDWSNVEKPNLLCGGFPCQDISIAGKKQGIKEGTRSGLWFEFEKAICILQPRIVVIENVPELANNGGTIVLGSLAKMGYNAAWFVISAKEVGAPHKRERFFIVANRNHNECDEEQLQTEGSEGKARPPFIRVSIADDWCLRVLRNIEKKIHRFKEFSWCENVRRIEDLRGRYDIPETLFRGSRDGIPYWMDRVKCLGNAVVPQVAQVIGESILEAEKCLDFYPAKEVADADDVKQA